MLAGITLKGKWAKRFGSDGEYSFEFKPGVNLLVGPNGSGKSSILMAIMDAPGKARHGESETDVVVRTAQLPGGRGSRFSVKMFDFEKQNPRVRDTARGGHDSFMFQVVSMFKSHGETNRALGVGLLDIEDVRDALVLLDEPDQALDFDGVGELIEALKKCPARQVLVAVHHPRVICSGEFHCVEMVPGYRDRIRLEMLRLVGKDDI